LPPVLVPALDETKRQLLADTRRLLDELCDRLVRLDAEEAHQRALGASLDGLEEPFLLVVVGEWNSGKSAFINALLGQPALEEGVTPTTTRIGALGHGERLERRAIAAGIDALTAPAVIRRGLRIVDTPGTNAVLREHEALTRDYLPRADLVLFVTSSDRPFTESERAFLEAIREWGKKVVVVLNKADLFETSEDGTRVLAFVREEAGRTLGREPEIFPVSARRALRARLAGDAAGLEASGVPAFEAWVAHALSDLERFRLKLLNPLGVGGRAREAASGVVGARLARLAGDVATLESVEAQLAAQAQDLTRDFRFRLADVEKALFDFERRGQAFFEERLRLSHFRELLRRERLRGDFEREVVAELPRDVEKRVEAIVDWMVEAELRQWQDVMAVLRGRATEHQGRLVGELDDRFEYDRRRRLDAVWGEAQRAISGYDAAAEAKRLAGQVRDAVAQTALLQVSALGLGAIVAVLASTTVADVTGILAAGALSVLGLFVLPARRARARADLARQVTALREKLIGALVPAFERERDRSQQKVREATGPWARFVRTEKERLEEARSALERIATGLDDLAARTAGLGR
jgi:GTP-binding protein EngB required for normal cell division